MANRAMSGVGGILMRCFLSSRVTVYVLTDFVPLNNVVVTISLCEMLDWRAAVLNIKQGSPTWCILNFHFDYLNTSLTINHHDDNLLKDSGLWLHNTITPLFTADIYTAHLSHCSLLRGCTINNNLESIKITSLVLC